MTIETEHQEELEALTKAFDSAYFLESDLQALKRMDTSIFPSDRYRDLEHEASALCTKLNRLLQEAQNSSA